MNDTAWQTLINAHVDELARIRRAETMAAAQRLSVAVVSVTAAFTGVAVAARAAARAFDRSRGCAR